MLKNYKRFDKGAYPDISNNIEQLQTNKDRNVSSSQMLRLDIDNKDLCIQIPFFCVLMREATYWKTNTNTTVVRIDPATTPATICTKYSQAQFMLHALLHAYPPKSK